MKFIPGLGSIAGGVMTAPAASAITTAFGEAYIAALDSLFVLNKGEPPSPQQVLKEFQKWIRKE